VLQGGAGAVEDIAKGGRNSKAFDGQGKHV
jgi:hypothetical protein